MEKFILGETERRSSGSLVLEAGCGNGKNVPASLLHNKAFCVASDISLELVKLVHTHVHDASLLDVQVTDIMRLPYRDGCADVVLCIAVLHHLSTEWRRKQAVKECCSKLRVGGKALFYAWAMEQGKLWFCCLLCGTKLFLILKNTKLKNNLEKGGLSGHVFEKQDLFVPFHWRQDFWQKSEVEGGSKATLEGANAEIQKTVKRAKHGVQNLEKRAIVFQRFCHVYKKGEIEELAKCLDGFEVAESWYDSGNHAMVVKRIR